MTVKPPQFPGQPPRTGQPGPVQVVPAKTKSSMGAAFLISSAIVIAGLLVGILAWHPWDQPDANERPRVFTQDLITDEAKDGGQIVCLESDFGVSCVTVPANAKPNYRPSR